MFKKGLLLLILICPILTWAQDDPDSMKVEKERNWEPLVLDFKPRIGLGVGMFTFYGDIANNHSGYHPTVSRVGYDLRVTNPITNYLDLSFYVIFGKLGSNERSPDRNLNFESNITTGGMTLFYNFHHALNDEHKINPYLSVGIESVEFLSKTDRYDKYGNEYFYWSDGSIRNMEELPGNESIAQIIQRDYTYESDIREMDLDGFGKYPERTWAVPVGIGANFDLSERWKFRIGTTMHFTFSDLVDGVTEESVGNRVGNSNNDKFLFTSFALNYDLVLGGKDGIDNRDDLEQFLIENSFDLQDKDNDGVEDFKDRCPDTPEGVLVDMWGCGGDTDGDHYADHEDDEVETPIELINVVDSKGVGKTDDQFLQEYLLYLDSGYASGEDMFEVVHSVVDADGNGGGPSIPSNVHGNNLDYVILVGNETQEVSANDLAKLLAYKNFRSYQSGGTVFYVLDGYTDINAAAIDQYKLSAEDLDAITNIAQDLRQSHSSGGSSTPFNTVDPGTVPTVDPAGIEIEPDKDLVLRVQIGAFSRPVSDKVFVGVPDLVYVKGEDGLYRYYSGMFDTPEEAAKHKVQMVLKGYEGAFIIGYENGERKTLKELGFEVIDHSSDTIEEDPNVSSVDQDKVSYRVQVGAYTRDVPVEVQNKFLDLSGAMGTEVDANHGTDGFTRYLIGTYSTRAEANAALTKVKGYISEAFVVGEFDGNLIPAEEADTLLDN